MKHIFVELMSQMTTLTEDECRAIENSFPIKEFESGHYLIKEGQYVKDSYYVLHGCVREFKLLDGEEKTISFFTENQSVANFKSLFNNTPSEQNYVCAEKCTIAILNSEKEKQLYQIHPRFEAFCRAGMEQMMGSKQGEMAAYMVLKPKQRYEKLQQDRPDLLNRVPQYQLASYLGIKPETLSRIRKQLANS